jgi:hypothetical protein
MKYLKSYKLFEAYVDNPIFTRFSHNDLLNGEEEVEFTPSERRMVGPELFNDILVDMGFPDKNRCVHFMDEVSYGDNPHLTSLYGKNIYNIKVDDNSLLGWCFVMPINDWFFRAYQFHNKVERNDKVKSLLSSELFEIKPESGSYQDSPEASKESANILIKDNMIGFGKLADLMNSPYWGKLPLFAWTNDTVKVSEKSIETKQPKEAKAYKKQALLTPEDFDSLGVSRSKIGLFYNSPEGRRLNIIDEELPYEERKEQALNLLKIWSENL